MQTVLCPYKVEQNYPLFFVKHTILMHTHSSVLCKHDTGLKVPAGIPHPQQAAAHKMEAQQVALAAAGSVGSGGLLHGGLAARSSQGGSLLGAQASLRGGPRRSRQGSRASLAPSVCSTGGAASEAGRGESLDGSNADGAAPGDAANADGEHVGKEHHHHHHHHDRHHHNDHQNHNEDEDEDDLVSEDLVDDVDMELDLDVGMPSTEDLKVCASRL